MTTRLHAGKPLPVRLVVLPTLPSEVPIMFSSVSMCGRCQYLAQGHPGDLRRWRPRTHFRTRSQNVRRGTAEQYNMLTVRPIGQIDDEGATRVLAVRA